MSTVLPVIHLARVTLQADTPLSVTTGANDPRFDTLLVRDANNLPMIPGSSVAGVLRHLCQSETTEQKTNELFGLNAREIAQRARARRERKPGEYVEEPEQWEASALQVSAALIHDQEDCPVERLMLPGEAEGERRQQDELLALAIDDQPVARDQVRLTEVGTVDDRGKFTRAAIAKGNRFTLELALRATSKTDERWERVKSLLGSAHFRLGGATRRGMGRVSVVRLVEASFDLRDETEARLYRAYDPSLEVEPSDGFTRHVVGERQPPISATLTLQAEDFFRFGAGTTPFGSTSGKQPHMLPASETVIEWKAQDNGRERGQIRSRRVLIAASGIKGALRHRSAFHYNRLRGRFGDSAQIMPPELSALFGAVRDDQAGESTGEVGRILIDDLILDDVLPSSVMVHNSIDRFSGGTRSRVLYSEEMLYQARFTLRISILQPAAITDSKLRRALHLALLDLAQGRLSLGAGGARGHGYFHAERGVEWSDLDWVERGIG